MNITATGTNVLLTLVKPETETPGGVALPESAQEQQPIGTVISAGSEVTNVSEGQTVIFDRHGRLERFDKDDQMVFVVPEADILAVIND